MTTERQQILPTPVRLPEDIKSALKAEADANDRSLNGEILQRLRQSLKGRRTRPQDPAADQHTTQKGTS